LNYEHEESGTLVGDTKFVREEQNTLWL